jgi:RNA polymerase sigma-70 factor (ECF subfamily)
MRRRMVAQEMGWRMAIGGLWRWDWPAPRGGWPALLAARLNTRAGQADDAHAPDAPDAPDAAAQAGETPPIWAAPTDAFEAFFREHERAVYACLWRLTGDPQAARDLTQETFLRAWRHFERVRAYEQPLAWLLRVATNLARTSHRREQRRPRSTETLTDADEPSRSDPTQRLAERDLVERTLLELPPNQRAALTLREVYGFSCAEIGAALGLSRDAVKMALYRGRESFRRHYLRKVATDER